MNEDDNILESPLQIETNNKIIKIFTGEFTLIVVFNHFFRQQ
jgi:hypothetical protein